LISITNIGLLAHSDPVQIRKSNQIGNLEAGVHIILLVNMRRRFHKGDGNKNTIPMLLALI